MQRTWLWGLDGGDRPALLLDFAPPNMPLDPGPPVGMALEGELAFYPGAVPLRALVAGEPESLVAGARGLRWSASAAAGLAAAGAAVAANPWTEAWPVAFAAAVPGVPGDGPVHLHVGGDALPMVADSDVLWRLAALAGGSPVRALGTWDGGCCGLWRRMRMSGSCRCEVRTTGIEGEVSFVPPRAIGHDEREHFVALVMPSRTRATLREVWRAFRRPRERRHDEVDETHPPSVPLPQCRSWPRPTPRREVARMTWESLVATALLGTERRAPEPSAPPGAPRELSAALARREPHEALLGSAAAWAVARRAGASPRQARPPTPAPQDPRPACLPPPAGVSPRSWPATTPRCCPSGSTPPRRPT